MNVNLFHEHFLHSAVAHPYYVYALLWGGEACTVGGIACRLRGGGGPDSVSYAGSYVEEVLPMRGGLISVKALLRNVERACVLVNANKGTPQLIIEYGGRCGMAHQLLEAVATSESTISYARDGVGNIHRDKTRTTRESICPYASNGVGYYYGDKVRATSERGVSYVRNGVRDDNRSKAAALTESVSPYVCNGAWDDNGVKYLAIQESIIPYNRYRVWDIHGGKARTSLESICPYASNGVGYYYGGKARAMSERGVPYVCNGIGDDNRGKVAAKRESIFLYARNGVFYSIVRYLFGDYGGSYSGYAVHSRSSVIAKRIFYVVLPYFRIRRCGYVAKQYRQYECCL